MSSIEETLVKDGRLIYTIKGVSMLPMLHQNQDIVVISVPKSKLKKYDVALYKRGKTYVLHRVIKVNGNGYLTRGDNTYVLEDVPNDAVIGVLTDFTRKRKAYTVNDQVYKCYVWLWCAIYPARVLCLKVRRQLVRIAKKLGIMELKQKTSV